MRRSSTISLSLALATLSALCAKKEPEWKTAKVLDSRIAKSSVATGSNTNSSSNATAVSSGGLTTASGEGSSSTSVDFANIRDNQLMLLGTEFAYIVEDSRVSGGHGLVGITEHAIANRKHGCRFIVGDNIQYWQEKAILHVRDADGKECKAEVLRQERLQQVSAPQNK